MCDFSDVRRSMVSKHRDQRVSCAEVQSNVSQFYGRASFEHAHKLADADNHTGSFSGATSFFSSLANAHHSGLVCMFHKYTKIYKTSELHVNVYRSEDV